MTSPSTGWRLALPLASLAAGAALPHCGGDPGDPASAWKADIMSGGDTTVVDTTRDAYSRTAPGIDPARMNQFFVGNSFFNSNWVTAPSSTEGRDGLGPTFNASSCSGCHFKDGRGRPPLADDEAFEGLLIRLSVPGADAHGGSVDEPTYGGQFNHRAVLGVPGEGRAVVRYAEQPGRLADGTAYSLRAPTYTFEGLAFGPMRADVMLSARVAPANFGLGLLESVAEDELLARADPDDRDHDGVSGRPNRVWSVRLARTVLGRFGWKANQPSLEQQNAGAFVGDLGVTSELFPDQNCPEAQPACRAAPSGGAPEIDAEKLAAVTLYTQTLAVPARRHADDATALRGADLFDSAGCTACHAPTLRTGERAVLPELAGQTFHPYTDLLLHDMGAGLADGRPDFLADGQEWRTPPLWGIGLVQTVNRHTFFLHDGRARSLVEAILWHGGEAQASRDRFAQLSAADRAALVRFLESL
ncbi:MAG: thiol oxidoreductase [Myxococcaceae bacterium]|nr:thiol oxidoreductase [Myxococcaceae bacterium]